MNKGEYFEQLGQASRIQSIRDEDRNTPSHPFSIT